LRITFSRRFFVSPHERRVLLRRIDALAGVLDLADENGVAVLDRPELFVESQPLRG
jgi:hypothetical protein